MEVEPSNRLQYDNQSAENSRRNRWQTCHCDQGDVSEHAYRALVVKQFGYWDESIQDNNFENKWQEQNFQKIYIDGQLIGGLWVEEFEAYHQLREIQLWPDFRHMGFGTRLIEEEIRKAGLAGRQLRLRVLIQNPAVALYKRLGFVIAETTTEQHHMVHEF